MTKKSALADQVAEKLQELIATQYHTGDRLPVENELAQRFGVSRITIREAMMKLKALGFVKTQRGSGTFVASLSPSSFMTPILPMLKFSNTDIREIFEVRILIECKAVENAALRAAAEELQYMQELLSEMESLALSGEIAAYNKKDILFHTCIAQCSHNQVIYTIYKLLLDMIRESILTTCVAPEHLLNSIIFHNRIHNSIVAHQPEQASEQMRQHLADALRFIETGINAS